MEYPDLLRFRRETRTNSEQPGRAQVVRVSLGSPRNSGNITNRPDRGRNSRVRLDFRLPDAYLSVQGFKVHTKSPAGASRETMADENKLIDALKQVIDPELMINIVDLGLVYDISRDEQNVKVQMTLTSPACPAGPQIIHQAKMALERLSDVDEAQIQLVMTPPWTPERMTDDARDQLGIF